MPQVLVPGSNGRQIVIAQAMQGESADLSAAARHSEKPQNSLGELPDPHLLFANSILVGVILVITGFVVTRNLKKIPSGVQNIAEVIADGLNNFVRANVGPGGEKYTPLVGTMFIYIFAMNLIGIIPGFHSPTSNITITLALGFCVFCYVQWEGIRAQGLFAHIKHFMGPVPAAAILVMPIELISEIAKPFTLAIRLFGNIFGEDVIMVVLASMGTLFGGSLLGWIPVQFPILLLMLLTDVVQALVFSILTCIYLSLVTQHHGAAHADHSAEHHGEQVLAH